MCDAKQMLEMAARLRKQAAETSLLTYAGLMLGAAQDLEDGAQFADILPDRLSRAQGKTCLCHEAIAPDLDPLSHVSPGAALL
jgi:hypothetical protein